MKFTMDSMIGPLAIPEHMRPGLTRYIERGIKPGSFMRAVLENDLKNAVFLADDINRQHLVDWVQILYTYAPGNCWGSPEKFKAWIAQGGLIGRSK